MVLRKSILFFSLMWAACSITPPGGGAFIDNLYSLSLKVPSSSNYDIAISQSSGSFTIKNLAADGSTIISDETVTVLHSFSSSKATARHKDNRSGAVNFISLQIISGALYRSEFFPKEADVSESTASSTLYLEKR